MELTDKSYTTLYTYFTIQYTINRHSQLNGGLASEIRLLWKHGRLLDFGGSYYEFVRIFGFAVVSYSDSYQLNSAPSPQTEEET